MATKQPSEDEHHVQQAAPMAGCCHSLSMGILSLVSPYSKDSTQAQQADLSVTAWSLISGCGTAVSTTSSTGTCSFEDVFMN